MCDFDLKRVSTFSKFWISVKFMGVSKLGFYYIHKNVVKILSKLKVRTLGEGVVDIIIPLWGNLG